MKNIDAKGQNCPMPVILAKRTIEAGETQFSVEVDNEIAVSNLKKLAENKGFNISTAKNADNFTVLFVRDGSESTAQTTQPTSTENWAVFVGKDIVGDGDAELGKTLVEMYFYTLSHSGNIPRYVLMMNSGVKLAVQNEQVITHLKTLADMGTQVHVCGACLNFYHMQNELKAGNISNMYEIVECMAAADKVVTI